MAKLVEALGPKELNQYVGVEGSLQENRHGVYFPGLALQNIQIATREEELLKIWATLVVLHNQGVSTIVVGDTRVTFAVTETEH